MRAEGRTWNCFARRCCAGAFALAVLVAGELRGLDPAHAETSGRRAVNSSGAAQLGTPKLVRTPLRPSFVQADLTVTRGGAPARPSAATCTPSFAGDKRYGRRAYPGRFTLGLVRCVFPFNNSRYLGKTLTGEISVVVAGTRVTKTFSVRIGPGNALEQPVGATVNVGVVAKPKPSATTEWRGTVHIEQADGTPGKPPGHRSLDIRLTLLPGASKPDPLGWTQPVSWVATYSSTSYSNPPCTDAAGNPVPSNLGERTVVRGRTGERPGSNAKDFPRVGVRWDAARSRWVIALSFFGGGGGGMRLPLVTKTTQNCGRTWVTYTGTPGLQNLTILANGTTASTVLTGTGTPTGFYNAKDTTVTWDLTLTRRT